MELINNRYRVIKILSDDYYITRYLVCDVLNKAEKLCINIINKDYVSEKFIKFLKEDFIRLKAANGRGIVSIYDFGIITNIDNSKTDELIYYYSSEYFEGNRELNDYYNIISNDDKLDMFSQICSTINTLYLKGYFYDDIRIEDIYINNKDGNYIYKIKDIVSFSLYKYKSGKMYERLKYTKLEYTTNYLKEEIQALSNLFFKIFDKDIKLNNDDRINSIHNYIEKAHKYGENIDIFSLIHNIENASNKKIPAFYIDEINKLNIKHEIIGRENIKKYVFEKYKNIIARKNRGSVIGIHGETGIGKTRVLQEIIHLFKLEGCNVFQDGFQKNIGVNSNLLNIIKRMIGELEEEKVNKYKKQWEHIISKDAQDDKEYFDLIMHEKMEKYKIINRFSSMAAELSRIKPIVFVIDDINSFNEIYMDIIEYLFSEDGIDILILFSYDDKCLLYDNKFIKFHNSMMKNENYTEIKLCELNLEDSIEMLTSILNAPYDLNNLGSRIHSVTYGNPLFIEEVVKNLFLTKEIYINKHNGIWSTDHDKVMEIHIPTDMEQATWNQIKEIDSKDYEILKNISLFKADVNIDIIEKIKGIDKAYVKSMLENYVSKGIIVKRTDEEIYYDFHNKILKKLIYRKLEKEEKKNKHLFVADALKDYTSNSSNEYLDELIFHMEMSEQYGNVVDFCLRYAAQFEAENMVDAAIKYLKKAVEAVERENKDSRLGDILIRLGKLYKIQGDVEKSISCYEKSYEIAQNFNMEELKIKALIKIGNFAFNKKEMGKCEKCIKNIDELNKKVSSEKFTLDSNLLKLRLYDLRQEYDALFKLCMESIELCGEKHFKYKGKLYSFLGNLNFDKDNVEEAMKNYEESIKYFEKAKDFKGTIGPLNSIGIIWIESYQDEAKSMECFLKVKEITEKNNYYESNVVALANIGENYLCMLKYEDALKHFKDGLEKSKKIYMEGAVFYNYIYMTVTLSRLQDYKNALKLLKITNEELIQHPEQGSTLMDYYAGMAEIMLTMGKIDKARELIKKAIERSVVDNSISKWNMKFIREKINLMSLDNGDIIPLVLSIKEIINGVSMKDNRTNMILEFSEILLKKGYYNEAAEIMAFQTEEIQLDRLKIRKLYVEALIGEWGERYDRLINALALTKSCDDKEMKWKICFEIGNYYYSIGEHFYAVNYYFQSAETIKILTESVEGQYKIDYFNFNHMYEPFSKLIEISNIYNEKEYNEDCNKIALDEAALKNLFMYENLKTIFSNPKFIKSAQDIFDYTHSIKAKDKKYILRNLCNDMIYNLAMIVEYVAREILAKNAYIILEEYKKEVKVLAGNEISFDKFVNKPAIDNVRSSKKTFFTMDLNYSENSEDTNAKDVVMCIPVTQKLKIDHIAVSEEKREHLRDRKQILGYLYIEADRVLNNLNQHTINKVYDVLPLAALLIEKYQLQISSSIDRLTGALTRKSLEDVLEEQYYDCKNNGNIFSIIMFDMDHFKSINDKYGHQNGDDVLQKVGAIISDNIRKIDYFGRYGGEEFIIVLPDTNLQGAEAAAEKLRLKIEGARLLGEKMNVTVSMGVSSCFQASSIKELVERADKSLYLAKKLGRNRVQVWQEEFNEKIDTSNKLTGIITGNDVQDYRNVSVIVELIELLKNKGMKEDKIYSFLGRIIEITEAQQGSFIVIKDGRIKETFGRKIFTEGWQRCIYNEEIIDEILKTGKGRCLIDWDGIYDYDSMKGIPDWKSILISPIINNGEVRGIIYLSVSSKTKEFEAEDLNYVGMLAQIMISII
ncbi:diguanylate cyclase [Clostridium sp. 19966]|uniref:diguanylate cyclase n=1 Tax=Clostridium sp. 19966 TaxID=2768166 RepID=UPI0028DE25C8|nr:diguanylate cyclase [Clostridium sp. 19966]MDT8716754.1 diguanylate cyclase [Clostridium sp. 19966]